MKLRPLRYQRLPDAAVADVLDYARGLGIIASWRKVEPKGRRHYLILFPDEHVAHWSAGMALCFGLGVRLGVEAGA